MPLVLITPPAAEPVTLDQAKAHMRVTHEREDDLIAALIMAAREQAEHMTGRQLMTATWELHLDAWAGAVFEIPRPPLQSVASVTYLDEDGQEQTVSPTLYTVDMASIMGRVVLKPGASWPTPGRLPGAVRVRFTAGYVSVPLSIAAWIKVQVATSYLNREEFQNSRSAQSSSPAYEGALPGRFIDRLLDPYIIPVVA